MFLQSPLPGCQYLLPRFARLDRYAEEQRKMNPVPGRIAVQTSEDIDENG
jgi:hypothetical protein